MNGMLQQLAESSFNGRDAIGIASQQITLWQKWLLPITSESPIGTDPGYDDEFQRMREEVNELSGADTELICQLSETLLTSRCKDVRVATYYIWARLQRDGEAGLADGLTLLAGLAKTFGESLLPARANSRKAALEWLAGSKMLDSLSRYPEVVKSDFEHVIAALCVMEQAFSVWPEEQRPQLGALYSALESRLAQSGGMDAVVPQNSAGQDSVSTQSNRQSSAPLLNPVQSGRDLLDQGKELARYLRDQPQGWLSASRLMKSLRWDTVHQLPPIDTLGRTRLVAPRTEYRAQLKRLYLQQNWSELLEQAERMFAEGVNHFWLDLQWYLCQALNKSGHPHDLWADMSKQDLAMLLTRLPGVENLAYSDGTPFADEVTLAWIAQQVKVEQNSWNPEAPVAGDHDDNDILALEPEAIAQADNEGIDKALAWLQSRQGIQTRRQRWLLYLLMARIGEQYGKNEMALHLLSDLDAADNGFTLAQWEPELMFEVKARRLKLLRMKAQRNDADKVHLSRQMDGLLSELVAIDPARATVLCG